MRSQRRVISTRAPRRSAELSPFGTYRYSLEREVLDDPSSCVFIMLNPSTADADIDAPTIRRCMGFVRSWGYGTLVVVNLFAFRSTDPRQLKKLTPERAIGSKNDAALIRAAGVADMVVCAWGAHGSLHGRDQAVRDQLRSAGIELHALRLTKHGQPAHPLYLPRDLVPTRWSV